MGEQDTGGRWRFWLRVHRPLLPFCLQLIVRMGWGGRRMGDLKQEHIRAGGEEEILLTSNA